MKATNKNFDDINIGDLALIEKSWSFDDIDSFAALSGDYNPLHTDIEYAKQSGFSSRVVHGMLIGSVCSNLVGMHLPGEKCLLLKESLSFHLPVFVDQSLLFEGKVVSKSISTGILDIEIIIHREHEKVASGNFVVKVRQ